MRNSLFWQFCRTEYERPSVIVGTIHLSVNEALIHWPRIESILVDYDDVFTESSLSAKDQTYVSNYVFFNEPNVYLTYLTQNRWNRMREVFLKYFEVDINLMKNMRPTFILAAIYQKRVLGQGVSLDQRIWNYADDNGKVVAGLESIIEQITILKKLSLKNQYRQMARMSRRIRGIQSQFQKILSAYETQDLQTLFRLSKGTLGPDKKILLENRNRILVDRMIVQHAECPSFFSFGAGHLVGKNGVLTLLKGKGLIIKSI